MRSVIYEFSALIFNLIKFLSGSGSTGKIWLIRIPQFITIKNHNNRAKRDLKSNLKNYNTLWMAKMAKNM